MIESRFQIILALTIIFVVMCMGTVCVNIYKKYNPNKEETK